jgi:ParB/RepB/Spo0J family partition protein
MNAPAKQQETQIRLPIDKLEPSKTNPRTRKGLDAVSLNEMAASIKAVDILQPILARPITSKPGINEIVCGERRWRGAKLAALADVPVIIRDLSDDEVLRIQLIENVQREDLDELEEAEGYERLMKQNDAKGQPYTADRIAELSGVSRATIYSRLKLLSLCPKAREEFYQGKLDASTALLIARVSPEKIQLEALADIIQRDMSYRDARDWIQRRYMLELKEAIFDIKDATLVKKSGSCTDCQKRTGNQPELFGDVKSKDVCTDAVCFGMKKAAHFLIVRNKAEAEGATIIAGAAAKKILPYSHSEDYYLEQSGFTSPSSKIPNDPKGRTWAQAIKQTKAPIQATIIENPHEKGEIIQAINMADAAKALREQGYEITLRNQSTRPVKTDKEKDAERKLKVKTKAENIYRQRLIDEIHTKAEQELICDNPQLRPVVFRLIAKEVFDQSKAYAAKKKLTITALGEKAEKMQSYESNRAFLKHLDTLTPQQCLLIMIDLIMATEEKVEEWQVSNKDTPDTLLALATIHKIDADAIKKKAEQEVTIEAEAKQKAREAKKPAVKKAAAKPQIAPQTAKTPAPAEWPFPTPGSPSKTASTPTPAAPAAAKGAAKAKPAAAKPAARAKKTTA